jgi:hypothetical protein
MSETPINPEQRGPEGQSLHSRLAADLETILAERQQDDAGQKAPLETEQSSSPEAGKPDWRTSAVELMQHSLAQAKEAMPIDMGPLNPNVLAQLQHGLIKHFKRSNENVENFPDAVSAFGPEVMRHFVLDKVGQDATTGVLYAGAIAMLTLPSEGYRGGKVPKRSKGRETDQQALFRLSIGYLRGQATIDNTARINEGAIQGKQLHQEAKQVFDRHQANPGDENVAREWEETSSRLEGHTERFKSTYIAKYEAGALVSSLAEATFTAEDAAEEMRGLERSYNEREAKRSQWHLLPPKPSGPRGETNGDASGEQQAQGAGDLERQERIDELYRLVEQWGDGSVEESEFVFGTKRRYLVAILPQHLPDGRVVEHAVLDTSRYGNALFLWRAEKGQTPGQPNLEWPEVFDEEYKPEAEAKGAIRIVHRGEWRQRVLDSLTRKAEDLPQ